MATPGFEKLEALVAELESTGAKRQEIAAEIGASPPLLSQWLSRKLRPGVGFVHRIEKWSEGFGQAKTIRTEDWLTDADRIALASVREHDLRRPAGPEAA